MRATHNEMGTLLLLIALTKCCVLASVASDIDINICVMSNNEDYKNIQSKAKLNKSY